MTTNEATLLMKTTKKEINSLRDHYIKKGQRCPVFPPHIWDNITQLTGLFSRKEILSNLSIVSSQYAKAMKAGKSSSQRKHPFVEVLSSTDHIAPSNWDQKKIILEIKTKNGNFISVFE